VTLPRYHRDPFDRMLIAQAQVEDLSVMTADSHFGKYDVKVVW
jgi:PIN domain nuclease of toxin-antitoxin system